MLWFMELQDDLNRIDRELESARAEAARWVARISGLMAEKAELERALASERTATGGPPGDGWPLDPARLMRTRAIEHVLRHANYPLGIRDILAELQKAGRSDDSYALVAATLQHLVNEGRVQRPARGQYTKAA